MSTLKESAVAAAKVAGWLALVLVGLIAAGMWRDAQQDKERQARLDAMMKPGPQHWQIINATKGEEPAAWAINVEDGTVMFCTADSIGQPSCQKAGN